MALTRRALIVAAMGAAVSACGAQDRPPTAGGPAVSGSTTPPTAATAASLAARAEIVARYQGVRPTRWGTDVAGVTTRLPTRDNVVALTFDACGGPHGSGFDAELVNLLRRRAVPATLFVNSRWVEANSRVFADLAADPLFEIGNHGTRHLPLSVCGRSAYGIAGTRDVGEVYDEVVGNRDTLARLLGKPPRYFRSGTAYYDEVAARVAADLGELAVGFAVNGDQGATLNPGQVAHAMAAATAGSIVIGHVNHPEGGTARGTAAAIRRLTGSGVRFVHLSEYL
jgi:peptidoglycan/xylan/chitin deacetylase (PgdA/CDA1 family)